MKIWKIEIDTKQVFLITIIISTLFISSLLFFESLRSQNGEDRIIVQNSRFMVYESKNTLDNGSDLITNSVKSYVITLDPAYLDDFYDEINENHTREAAINYVKDIGEIQNYIMYLDQALAYSNELVVIEKEAITAVENGEVVLARSIVFSSNYDDYKENIKTSTNLFYEKSLEKLEQKDTQLIQSGNLYKSIIMYELIGFLTFIVLALVLFYRVNISVKHDSEIDKLTGLINKRKIESEMKEIIPITVRQKWPISFLMLDVDNFKLYNDHFGHIKGDEVLKIIATQSKKVLQRPMDLAGRFGGEEFIIILPNTTHEGGLKLGNRIIKEIYDLNIVHAPESPIKYLTVSIGVTTAFPSTVDVDFLSYFELADQALYEAKSNGRNTIASK